MAHSISLLTGPPPCLAASSLSSVTSPCFRPEASNSFPALGSRRSSGRTTLQKLKHGPSTSPRCSMQDAQRLVERKVVKMIRPDGVKKAISEEGYRVLDVRPSWEHDRAHAAEALHVPLFIEDTANDTQSFLRKSAVSGYGGMWMGFRSTIPNDDFVEQVERVAKKTDKLLVACGDGLRSLLATEVLHKNGFQSVAWLAEGFAKCSDQDIPKVVGKTELRFAHIGGAAYYLVKGLQLVGALKGVDRVAPPRTD